MYIACSAYMIYYTSAITLQWVFSPVFRYINIAFVYQYHVNYIIIIIIIIWFNLHEHVHILLYLYRYVRKNICKITINM